MYNHIHIRTFTEACTSSQVLKERTERNNKKKLNETSRKQHDFCDFACMAPFINDVCA